MRTLCLSSFSCCCLMRSTRSSMRLFCASSIHWNHKWIAVILYSNSKHGLFQTSAKIMVLLTIKFQFSSITGLVHSFFSVHRYATVTWSCRQRKNTVCVWNSWGFVKLVYCWDLYQGAKVNTLKLSWRSVVGCHFLCLNSCYLARTTRLLSSCSEAELTPTWVARFFKPH